MRIRACWSSSTGEEETARRQGERRLQDGAVAVAGRRQFQRTGEGVSTEERNGVKEGFFF